MNFNHYLFCHCLYDGRKISTIIQFFAAISGKYEDMQYNELNEFDDGPDVSELEALKRSVSPTLFIIKIVFLPPVLVILAGI